MFPRHPCATDTHMDRREKKKIPSDSTTETKWRLWEPSYVYSIGLLYFSSHRFEDCFNVRGGFNVVLPSGHYFPVCHAEERWEIKNWELQRVTVDRWGTHAYAQAAGISCPVEYRRYKKGLFLRLLYSGQRLFIPVDLSFAWIYATMRFSRGYLLAILASVSQKLTVSRTLSKLALWTKHAKAATACRKRLRETLSFWL